MNIKAKYTEQITVELSAKDDETRAHFVVACLVSQRSICHIFFDYN